MPPSLPWECLEPVNLSRLMRPQKDPSSEGFPNSLIPAAWFDLWVKPYDERRLLLRTDSRSRILYRVGGAIDSHGPDGTGATWTGPSIRT